eukprot:TRINITY_DN1069_c0_g1_i1.p1 TRINITY_DN1069_c0_g1~~TRINITY_DN1069_c0_g1_i1.p1  ORF type:complete len:604 (+),score=174.08 TRINITY_DN1069_c0_g1_i1:132-1943(+)
MADARVGDLWLRAAHHGLRAAQDVKALPPEVTWFAVPKRLRGSDPKCLMAAAVLDLVQEYVEVLPDLRKSVELGEDLATMASKVKENMSSLQTAAESIGIGDMKQKEQCAKAIQDAQNQMRELAVQYKASGNQSVQYLQRLARVTFNDFLPIVFNLIQAFDLGSIEVITDDMSPDEEVKIDVPQDVKLSAYPPHSAADAASSSSRSAAGPASPKSKNVSQPPQQEAKPAARFGFEEAKSQTPSKPRPAAEEVKPETPKPQATTPKRQSTEKAEPLKRQSSDSSRKCSDSENIRKPPKSHPSASSRATPPPPSYDESVKANRSNGGGEKSVEDEKENSSPIPKAKHRTSRKKHDSSEDSPAGAPPVQSKTRKSTAAAKSATKKPAAAPSKIASNDDLLDMLFESPAPSASQRNPEFENRFGADFDVPLTELASDQVDIDMFGKPSTPKGFSYASAQSEASAAKVKHAAKERVKKYRAEQQLASDREAVKDAMKRSLETKLRAWEYDNFNRRRHVAQLLADIRMVIWEESPMYKNPPVLADLKSSKKIKAAVKRIQAECHPDRQVGSSLEKQITAQCIFQAVNAAYEEFLVKLEQYIAAGGVDPQ